MSWILGLLEIGITIAVIKGIFGSFGKKKSKEDRGTYALVYFFAGLLIIGLSFWGISSNTEIPRSLIPIVNMADAYEEKHPEEKPSWENSSKKYPQLSPLSEKAHKNDELHKKSENSFFQFLIALIGGGLSFLYSLYSLIRYLTTNEEKNINGNVVQNNTTPPVNPPTQPNNGGNLYNGGHNATANHQPQQRTQQPQPQQRKPQGGKGQFNGNLYN